MTTTFDQENAQAGQKHRHSRSRTDHRHRGIQSLAGAAGRFCIRYCISMAYGFSVFWLPLSARNRTDGEPRPVLTCRWAKELFTTTCDWRVASMGWMFTLFFVFLGVSAAIWGGWLERVGPRKAGVVAAICWAGGLVLGAIGIYIHQLWLMWLGSGVIGGVGLGLGYISPVSTLIKWFPDHRGMATGFAIAGFGGGTLIGAPLANLLINYFKTPTDVGVWQTFLVMGVVYFVFMMIGTAALSHRHRPATASGRTGHRGPAKPSR